MKNLAVLFTLVFSSCQSLKYQADNAFLNSAQANSMEYFVRVNRKPCRDIDDKYGLCAKRIASNETLTFSMDQRPYAYRFELKCSSSVDTDFAIDIEAYKPFSFKIEPEQFEGVKSFTCIGEIFPHDRDQEVSATWSVRVVVYDHEYLEREIIYKKRERGRNFLVMGVHAKYVSINGKSYKRKPVVKVKSKRIFAYSESERMRFNYFSENLK